VGLAFVVLGGLRAAAVQKAANQIVFNEKIKAPAPPAFAYEIPKPALAPAAKSPEAEKANSTPESTAKEPTGESVAENLNLAAPPKSPPPAAPPASSTVVATKPPTTPEVFPRMETGPLRHRWQSGISPVFSVPTEMILAGHYTTQSKARDKQKIVGMMLFPSKVILHHTSKGDTWNLYVGPIKVSRGPLDVEALEAKGFSGAKEVSMADFQKAQK